MTFHRSGVDLFDSAEVTSAAPVRLRFDFHQRPDVDEDPLATETVILPLTLNRHADPTLAILLTTNNGRRILGGAGLLRAEGGVVIIPKLTPAGEAMLNLTLTVTGQDTLLGQIGKAAINWPVVVGE